MAQPGTKPDSPTAPLTPSANQPIITPMPSASEDPALKGLFAPPATQLTPAGDYVPIPLPEESVDLELPTVRQLLPVAGKLPAIRLEASYTQPISLREALVYALDYNLPIRISQAFLSNQKWLWGSSIGGFLPNVLMTYRQQILSGSSLVQGVIPVTFHTPNVNTFVTFQQYVFQGGKVLFGEMFALNNFKAAKFQLKGSVNDQLLAVAKNYYNLLLNQALLQTQVRAVENSRAQLALNQKLEVGGVGTRFNVMQSETQLASDEQNLLAQEVALRQAALTLAVSMDLDPAVNFLPLEHTVMKVRLIDPTLDINDLLKIAIQYRPELRQFNYLRLAALRNIQIQAAPLYPSMYLFATITGTGATLTRQHTVQPGSLKVVPVSAPSPGQPLSGGGSGGLSGGSLTSTQGPPNFTDVNPVAPGLVWSPAVEESRQIRKSTAYGFEIDWNYYGLGVPVAGNILAAKATARQSMLQFNQTLLNVLQQVRSAYLNSEIAERQIDVSSKAVVSSGEQLRLAEVRLANGVGTNIDVIQAQQAWTQARVNKINAIIQFNIAQTQLLHDLGVISLDTLTSGRLLRK